MKHCQALVRWILYARGIAIQINNISISLIIIFFFGVSLTKEIK